MSVRDRLIDAKALYANGRREGALLSVLVAVAATARKRFPRGTKNNGDAFRALLAEELPAIVGVGQFNVNYRGSMTPLQDLLYRYARCNLAHEAHLPEDIHFERSDMLTVNVTEDAITFSDKLIDILSTVVRNAKENKCDFAK